MARTQIKYFKLNSMIIYSNIFLQRIHAFSILCVESTACIGQVTNKYTCYGDVLLLEPDVQFFPFVFSESVRIRMFFLFIYTQYFIRLFILLALFRSLITILSTVLVKWLDVMHSDSQRTFQRIIFLSVTIYLFCNYH